MIEDLYEGLGWERRLRKTRARLEDRPAGPALASLLCGAALALVGLLILVRTLLGDLLWGLVDRLAFETNTFGWTVAGLLIVALGLLGMVDAAESSRREELLLLPETG